MSCLKFLTPLSKSDTNGSKQKKWPKLWMHFHLLFQKWQKNYLYSLKMGAVLWSTRLNLCMLQEYPMWESVQSPERGPWFHPLPPSWWREAGGTGVRLSQPCGCNGGTQAEWPGHQRCQMRPTGRPAMLSGILGV